MSNRAEPPGHKRAKQLLALCNGVRSSHNVVNPPNNAVLPGDKVKDWLSVQDTRSQKRRLLTKRRLDFENENKATSAKVSKISALKPVNDGKSLTRKQESRSLVAVEKLQPSPLNSVLNNVTQAPDKSPLHKMVSTSKGVSSCDQNSKSSPLHPVHTEASYVPANEEENNARSLKFISLKSNKSPTTKPGSKSSAAVISGQQFGENPLNPFQKKASHAPGKKGIIHPRRQLIFESGEPQSDILRSPPKTCTDTKGRYNVSGLNLTSLKATKSPSTKPLKPESMPSVAVATGQQFKLSPQNPVQKIASHNLGEEQIVSSRRLLTSELKDSQSKLPTKAPLKSCDANEGGPNTSSLNITASKSPTSKSESVSLVAMSAGQHFDVVPRISDIKASLAQDGLSGESTGEKCSSMKDPPLTRKNTEDTFNIVVKDGPEKRLEETDYLSAQPVHQNVIMVSDDDQFFPDFYMEDDEDFDASGDIGASTVSVEVVVPSDCHTPSVNTCEQIETLNESPVTPATSGKSKRKVSPRDNVRKRGVNTSLWKNNVAKDLLNRGQSHVTPRGKERRQRELGPPCPDNCHRCAKPRLTVENRQEIFNYFWNLGSHVRQWDYLSRHVKCSTPKKTTARPGKEKKTARQYFLVVDGKSHQVCKRMFLNTFDIADCWIESAIKNVASGKSLSPDKRGKHLNRPHRVPQPARASVHEHIGKLPRVYSHYTREKSKKEYLENGLSIERLYKEYVEWVVCKNMSKVASSKTYREIFIRNYNIGFHVPRKDQCLQCNTWKSSTKETRVKMLEKYEKHLKNKKSVNKLKDSDKLECQTNSTLCVAAFDLQKVLTVPRSDTSVFFYKNKVSLYNLTVFDLHSKIGQCYMWNETEAKRGPNEVGSALFHFMQTQVSKGFKEFRLYSDCCSGQNRNRFIFMMYIIASFRFKIKIIHRFLETGHSYSEVDSVHARIENEAKGKHIFSIEEWNDLILTAKQTGEKYEIVQMADKVVNFSGPVNKLNWSKDVNNQKIYWSKVREVIVDPEVPLTLTLRFSFEEEPTTLNLKSKQRGHPINLETYKLPLAYKGKIPLKNNKRLDIEDCMNNLSIPEKYHEFYKSIIAAEANEGEDESQSNCDESEVDSSEEGLNE